VRLASFYFGVFLLSGAGLLAATVSIWHGTSARAVSAHPVPGPGASHHIRVPSPAPSPLAVQHSSDFHNLLIAAAMALGLMAALSVVLGWLAAGRFLKPLRTITTTTRRISATNLNQRLNLTGPEDELKELGDTFDDLLSRLETSFEAERLFVANASHELRTPLTTMRASLDVAMAKPGQQPPQMVALSERLRREMDHVDLLLDSFLTLAQAQGAPVSETSVVPISDLAYAALERRSQAISLLGLQVGQEVSPLAGAQGSEILLARLVDNLVDNAVKHNQRGGWLSVKSEAEGNKVFFIVENGGALLAQDQVDGLARPFRRLGPNRTGSEKGTGLGLAIVKSIAEAHGGALSLRARADGGLRAVVTLPLAGGDAVPPGPLA
jgi:signal transduction histidine kinase